MTKTVGVICLGNMGRGIAKNIALADHQLLVWDVSENARDAQSHIAQITSPSEMAAQADVIIFVVPGSEQIDEILDDLSLIHI